MNKRLRPLERSRVVVAVPKDEEETCQEGECGSCLVVERLPQKLVFSF